MTSCARTTANTLIASAASIAAAFSSCRANTAGSPAVCRSPGCLPAASTSCDAGSAARLSRPTTYEDYWHRRAGRFFARLFAQGYWEKFRGQAWADMPVPEAEVDGSNANSYAFNAIRQGLKLASARQDRRSRPAGAIRPRAAARSRSACSTGCAIRAFRSRSDRGRLDQGRPWQHRRGDDAAALPVSSVCVPAMSSRACRSRIWPSSSATVPGRKARSAAAGRGRAERRARLSVPRRAVPVSACLAGGQRHRSQGRPDHQLRGVQRRHGARRQGLPVRRVLLRGRQSDRPDAGVRGRGAGDPGVRRQWPDRPGKAASTPMSRRCGGPMPRRAGATGRRRTSCSCSRT